MNWGNRILILYITFISLILFMVVKSTWIKSDLVSPNYYQDEIRFQQKIDASTSKLSKQIQIKQGTTSISIITPPCAEISYDSLVCHVYFPSSIKHDVEMKFLCNSEKNIDISKLPQLPFVIKINIYSNGRLIAYREI